MPLHAVFAPAAAVASRHHGLLTRRQANRAGLTDRRIDEAVRAGVFERVARHVFRIAGSPETWEQRLLAACLAGGPDCLASHRAAAALHRFDGFAPGIVEVVVPRPLRHRRAGAVVHHAHLLPPSHRARVGRIPVTSPARTLVDLGAVARADAVEEAFDGAERDGLVTEGEVRRCYEDVRARGRNGVGPMGVMLERRDLVTGRPRSVLERRMLRLLERHGLPLPVCQHRVVRSDGEIAYLDFAYVDVRLGIEVDGHGSHATRRQRAADHARANSLAGWAILRFTYEQVVREETYVAGTVRRALAARGVLALPATRFS